jgi:hypothetical protein
MLGKVSTRKHDNLQAFCTLLKRPAKYRAAFARRMAWVRIPSPPLLNFLQTMKKLKILVVTPGAPCSNRAATEPQPD